MDSDKVKSALGKYLRGDFEKQFLLKRAVPLIIVIFFGFILLALALYPPVGEDSPYSIFTNSISSLGDWSYNTNGWPFFSIALIFLALTIWPFIPYTFKRVVGICKHTSRFGLLFGLLAPIGIFLTALFAENGVDIPGTDMEYGDIHGPVAVAGFGGLAFALLFWTCPLMKDYFRGQKKVPFNKLIPAYVFFLFIVIGTLGTQGYLSIVDVDGCGGFSSCDSIPLLAWGFWEWMLLFSLTIYLPFFIWVLPEEPVQEDF